MPVETATFDETWLHKLERGRAHSDDGLAGALESLTSRSAVSVQALTGPVLGELIEAAGRLPFRPARSEVGKPEARVYQEFGYCGAVPPDHPLHALGPWVDSRLRAAQSLMPDPPLDPSFHINDVVCQVYRPGELGITPHRDHIAYTGLIVLLILGGRGRYFVCADRQGRDRREVFSGPGSIILMPGPGFAGRRHRPFHMVTSITELRYSVGLRHDARKTAG